MITPQSWADCVIDDILSCDVFTVTNHVWTFALLIGLRACMVGWASSVFLIVRPERALS